MPHLIAYNIVGTVNDLERVTEKEVIKFSASGFRDFTRIAASDLTDVARHLHEQQRGGAGNPGPLHRRLGQPAKGHPLGRRRQAVRPVYAHARRPPGIIDARQDTAAPDFGRKAVSAKPQPKKTEWAARFPDRYSRESGNLIFPVEQDLIWVSSFAGTALRH